MLRNTLTATTAVVLALAPIAAQAAPQQIARTGSDVAESEQLVGTTMWIVAAIALGLVVWGIIELSSDDEPTSP